MCGSFDSCETDVIAVPVLREWRYIVCGSAGFGETSVVECVCGSFGFCETDVL